MTSTHITPEQAEQARQRAVAAVTRFYSDAETDGHTRRERDAVTHVTDAVRIYGVTAAQIALAAGVRQLLVARLITDARERAQALAAARHDAQRYLDQVQETLRRDVVASVHGGMPEAEAARVYGINRMSVRKWTGKGD